MKTLKKVPIKPIYVEYMPTDQNMVQGEIYISKRFEVSIHLCLCGCGMKTVLPIDQDHKNKSHGWKLTENGGEISFTPSILNPSPCNAHYIITKNVANII